MMHTDFLLNLYYSHDCEIHYCKR